MCVCVTHVLNVYGVQKWSMDPGNEHRSSERTASAQSHLPVPVSVYTEIGPSPVSQVGLELAMLPSLAIIHLT